MDDSTPGVFRQSTTPARILCCLCGIDIESNPTNMCVNCLRTQVDITEGIQKQCSILWCKECNRYLSPPKHWVAAELESKELLTYCIKRVRGLQKVRLVDAGFIWTEPHSRRLKVKVTIQKEAFNGAILQQSFVVDYVVEPHMCDVCSRAAANSDQWAACVQVRQKVEHKRTFFFVEQVLVKSGASLQAIRIKEASEGLDFYFSSRSHALRLVEFISSVIPVRSNTSRQLVSQDVHTSSYNYKYTFSVEIIPVCKDDLVCLPPKVSRALGSVGPLMLCNHISSSARLVDMSNLRTIHMDANQYWRSPFKALMSHKQLSRFIVLDIEIIRGQEPLADIQVARESDLGQNDVVFDVRSHLGGILHPGDFVLGYDLQRANLNDENLDQYAERMHFPDVVLVRKCYDEGRRRRKQRNRQRKWNLKRLEIESQDNAYRKEKAAAEKQSRDAADYERFLEELEEDPEMRQKVALFRATNSFESSSEIDEDDVPQVPLDELLDTLTLGSVDEDFDVEEDMS